MSGPADNNMADAMETWYYGVGTDSFEAEFNPDGTTTGNDTHGSRVIWRASTQMGCAVSNCPGNDNSDSFSVMCNFGNGVSWNQVSKPGTCNPTETDVKVNLGKPLGHTPPVSNSAFSQGYTIPGFVQIARPRWLKVARLPTRLANQAHYPALLFLHPRRALLPQ